MKYKVGDKFRWRKEACFVKGFLNDVYELAKRDSGDYYVKTIYSEENDYKDWDDNNSYEEILKRINEYLEKIED